MIILNTAKYLILKDTACNPDLCLKFSDINPAILPKIEKT